MSSFSWLSGISRDISRLDGSAALRGGREAIDPTRPPRRTALPDIFHGNYQRTFFFSSSVASVSLWLIIQADKEFHPLISQSVVVFFLFFVYFVYFVV